MKKNWDEFIKNKNQGQVLVSSMQMATPYYPESVLAKSKFHGFYTLFYMFTLYFSIMFPALNYLRTGTLFQKAYFKIIQTNFYWDFVSMLIFILISLFLMSLSHITKSLSKKLTKKYVTILFINVVGFLWLIYIGIGFYIVRNYQMYFTDKIFIVVMSWAFFIKTLSYIFDMHQILQINSKFGVQRKQFNEKLIQDKQITFVKRSSQLLEGSFSTKLKTKIIYLMSPEIVFKNFILNYDQNLKIHPIYIINKSIVALICLFANLIVMIQLVQPLCEKQNLQKYKFIQLFFRFIPNIFYVNICLYFMILQNILPAIAQATKMKRRIYYQDWWNAQNIYDFLDRWVLLINGFTKQYLKDLWENRKIRQSLHVSVIFFLIFQIFHISQKGISMIPFIILVLIVITLTYFLGGISKIQNNHIVHIIIFTWSPLMLTIQMKYSIFTGSN